MQQLTFGFGGVVGDRPERRATQAELEVLRLLANSEKVGDLVRIRDRAGSELASYRVLRDGRVKRVC
jgi:hypothetical protein